MKQQFQKLAERIDAMTLRERAILFFTAAMVLIFLFNLFLSNPVTKRQREVARELAQVQVDMRKARDDLKLLVKPAGETPEAQLKSRIESLRQQLSEMDGRLSQKQQELVPPERIPSLLEEMLRRERKLELVELRSLPPTALFDKKSKAAAEAPPETMQVYRHGVEITVRGSYFDLMNYLAALEELPMRMFWREVAIEGQDYPTITMKLSVYTLSLDRTWVVV